MAPLVGGGGVECGRAGWLILGGRLLLKEAALHLPFPLSQSLGSPLRQGKWTKLPVGEGGPGGPETKWGLEEGRQDITLIQNP